MSAAVTDSKHDGEDVCFPYGTDFEVRLSDDASLGIYDEEGISLRAMALQGWAAMIEYVANNGTANFTVRATMYDHLSDGSFGKATGTVEHRVSIDNETLMQMLRDQTGLS